MKITFKKMEEIANQVLNQSYESLTEQSIQEDMQQIVEKQKHALVMKALGLDDNWDRELSLRYKGSFSQVMEMFSKEHLNRIAKKVWENIFEDKEFALTEKEKTHLRSEYRKAYVEAAENKIRYLAEEAANQDIEEQFKNFLEVQE